MAKLLKMTVSYSTKMSLDYQCVEGGGAVDLELLEEGDSPVDAYKRAHGTLRALVDKDVKAALLDVCAKMARVDRKAC